MPYTKVSIILSDDQCLLVPVQLHTVKHDIGRWDRLQNRSLPIKRLQRHILVGYQTRSSCLHYHQYRSPVYPDYNTSMSALYLHLLVLP